MSKRLVDIRSGLKGLMSVAVLAAVAGTGHAASIYNTAVGLADYTGSRSTDPNAATGGLTGNGNWSTDFHIAWSIVNNGNGTLTYTYTFTGFGNPNRDISNFVLDISDNCIGVDPLCIVNATLNGNSIGSGDIEYGDFNGITGAVKFDVGSGGPSAVYEFTSNRLPVWGHLAMKDGGGPNTCGSGSFGGTALACSNQLLGIGSDMDKINFVARPDGHFTMTAVPVPAAAWLFGSALCAFGWLRRRSAAALASSARG